MGYIKNAYKEFDVNEVRDYHEVPVTNIRLVEERRFLSDETIDNEEKVVRLMHEELSGCDRENAYVVAMDEEKRPLCVIKISTGNEDNTFIDVKDVMKALLLTNCSKFILLHNHVNSSNLIPSDNDVVITKRLMDASKLLGFIMLDHYVCGPDPTRRTSFAARRIIDDKEDIYIEKKIDKAEEHQDVFCSPEFKNMIAENRATLEKINANPFKRLFMK